jgi:hypothetical protein
MTTLSAFAEQEDCVAKERVIGFFNGQNSGNGLTGGTQSISGATVSVRCHSFTVIH